jgi:outer membrane protein OmpA-like peptidoglycan-associated protein
VAPAPPPPQAPIRDTVDFDHGKARVTNIAKAKLDAVALRLRDNPRATITVTGYPDAGGPRQETLARQRAENIKQYLMERHGIDASRITTNVDMTDTANRGKGVLVTILP